MYARLHLMTSIFVSLLFLIPDSKGQLSSTTSTSTVNQNFTTLSINSSTISPTTPTTTIMTTTLKPVSDAKHNTDIAVYVLELTVSPDNSSDIQYLNLTGDMLLDKLSHYFRNFSFGVSLNMTSGQELTTFVLSVEFLVKMVGNDSMDLEEKILAALSNINNSQEFIMPAWNMTASTVREFISTISDVCTARNICPLGFTCFSQGCQHLCRTRDCSNHGTCYTSIASDSTVTTLCQCDMEYDTEYQGDNCEYSRRGRLQIIAIIAGVLGAACLVFIIVIIIMCVKYRRHKSSSNYNLSGASYGNNAFVSPQEK